MIILNPENTGWPWGMLDHSKGASPVPLVHESGEATRISAVLGPDGEPLRVGFERPKLGFDLRPKGERK